MILWPANKSNTRLLAPGALTHRLQRRTDCKIQNGRWGPQNGGARTIAQATTAQVDNVYVRQLPGQLSPRQLS